MKMIKKFKLYKLILFTHFLFVFQLCYAETFNGNKLYEFLLQDQKSKSGGPVTYMSGYGTGFISGVIDSDSFQEIFYNNKRPYCIPNGVTNGQIYDIVFQHLEKHPEKRHWSSAALVYDAMLTAFPCAHD